MNHDLSFEIVRNPLPGKRERLSVGASPVAITPAVYTIADTDKRPKRLAAGAILQVYGGSIYYTVDGSTPSATVGFTAAIGELIKLDTHQKVASFKALQNSGAATVEVLPLW